MVTFNLTIVSFGFLAVGLARVFGVRFAFAALLPFYFINFSGFLELWTKAAGWLVMLAAANVIVRTERQAQSPPWLLFYLLGAGTAFFDLLTTPLLVFGFPAALHLLMVLRERPMTARDQIIRLLLIGCFFAIGYAGLWLAKIVIVSAVIGPEIWAATAKTAAFRISGSLDSVKHFIGAATLENLEAFKGLWGALAVIVFFIAPFVRRAGRTRFAQLARTAPGLIAIAISPFVCYEILSNHSQIHGLFTHANLVLTFLPFSLVLLNVAGVLAPAPYVAKEVVMEGP